MTNQQERQLYNDFERELSPYFLSQLGASTEWVNQNRYIYRSDHLYDAKQSEMPYLSQLFNESDKVLYWLGQKSNVDEKAAKQLQGAFDWTDFDFVDETGERQMTPLRFQDDLNKAIYDMTDPTISMSLLFGSDYHRLCTSIFELPRRIVFNLPLLEKRTYSALYIDLTK